VVLGDLMSCTLVWISGDWRVEAQAGFLFLWWGLWWGGCRVVLESLKRGCGSLACHSRCELGVVWGEFCGVDGLMGAR